MKKLELENEVERLNEIIDEKDKELKQLKTIGTEGVKRLDRIYNETKDSLNKKINKLKDKVEMNDFAYKELFGILNSHEHGPHILKDYFAGQRLRRKEESKSDDRVFNHEDIFRSIDFGKSDVKSEQVGDDDKCIYVDKEGYLTKMSGREAKEICPNGMIVNLGE